MAVKAVTRTAAPRSAVLPVMLAVCAALLGASAAHKSLKRVYDRVVYRNQARCRAAQPTYDWGTALAGETVRHTFRIENRGGQPLEIQRWSGG